MALLKSRVGTSFLQHTRQYSILSRNFKKPVHVQCICPVQSMQHRWLMWEKDRKGGYDTAYQVSKFQHLKEGFKELKGECKLWLQELKELMETDPLLIARPGKMCLTILDCKL